MDAFRLEMRQAERRVALERAAARVSPGRKRKFTVVTSNKAIIMFQGQRSEPVVEEVSRKRGKY